MTDRFICIFFKVQQQIKRTFTTIYSTSILEILMKEKNIRLAPSKKTLIQLFAKSGNLCSFSNCTTNLFNDENIYVAQVCHIRAVSSTWRRHVSSYTSDDLRKLDNLILLCYEHHAVVDTKDSEYTIIDLLEIKKKHEKKYESSNNQISDSQVVEVINCFNRLDEKLDWFIHKFLKDSHLKENISYNINPHSKILVKRKKIFVLIALLFFFWLVIMVCNLPTSNSNMGFPMLLIFSLTCFGLIPAMFFSQFAIGKEVYFIGKFYKRIRKLTFLSYAKEAICPFPHCSGKIVIKVAPPKEKGNFILIGCCTREPQLHTFSCESDNTIGYYHKMDFSKIEPQKTLN